MKLDRYAGVVEACDDALERFKGANPMWRGELKEFRIAALRHQGKLDDIVAATRDIQDQTSSSTEKARCAHWIADVYFQAGQYGKAAAAFLSAARSDKSECGQARATFYLGLCQRNRGNTAAAERYMDETISNYPDSEWGEHAREALTVWQQASEGN